MHYRRTRWQAINESVRTLTFEGEIKFPPSHIRAESISWKKKRKKWNLTLSTKLWISRLNALHMHSKLLSQYKYTVYWSLIVLSENKGYVGGKLNSFNQASYWSKIWPLRNLSLSTSVNNVVVSKQPKRQMMCFCFL